MGEGKTFWRAWRDGVVSAHFLKRRQGSLFVPDTLFAFDALEHLDYGPSVRINHDPNEP